MKLTANIPQAEINKLLRQVRFWEIKKQGQIVDLIEETLDAIVKDAKALAPVDEGDLRKSVRRVLDKGTGKAAMGGVVTVTDWKAMFLEFGVGMAGAASGRGAEEGYHYGAKQGHVAQPFLFPAFEAHIHVFMIKLKRIIQS